MRLDFRRAHPLELAFVLLSANMAIVCTAALIAAFITHHSVLGFPGPLVALCIWILNLALSLTIISL